MYDRVGGAGFFETLTQRFYAAVATDDVLRPMYPADDDKFEAARHHLELFLVQHWGGPEVYRSERGEARLRQRHRRFHIDPAARDAWLRHMTDAVKAAGMRPLDETQMLSFFAATAHDLVNQS